MSGFLDVLDAFARRVDGWQNLVSGLGVRGRDRAVSTVFSACADLDDQTLSDLYHYSDLPALIVDIYPEEALRRGFGIAGAPDVARRWRVHGLEPKIADAARWGRLFGLAVAVVYTDDGAPATAPLDTSRPWPVRAIEVFDRRFVVAVPGADLDYANAPILRCSRANGVQFEVHRSRCLVFGGATTEQAKREARGGADLSVLQRPYEIIRDYANGFLALGNMLTDASQGVFRMAGLIDSLASAKRERLEERLRLLDVSRSIARMVFLDANGQESFEKVATAFGGVPESIDRLTGRLSVATGIPVERLGQALAGLNATGESTTRAWYDRVESYRRDALTPQIRKLARIELGGALEETEIVFPPFWQPTAVEASATAKTRIDAGAALYDRGAVTSVELAVLASEIGITIDPSVPRGADLPPEGAPPVAPPAPLEDDEEAAIPDEHTSAFAEQMTKAGAETCEHGRRNRCLLCGIERVRGASKDPATGSIVFARGWRAIPR